MDEILISLFSALLATLVAGIAYSKVLGLKINNSDFKERKVERLKDFLAKKFAAGIRIELSDLEPIGRGCGLSLLSTIKVINQLYSEADNKETHDFYKKIIDEFHRTEPFEKYPAELQPCLARISTIIKATGEESDILLLGPIVKFLDEHQSMKVDHASMKKQTRNSYLIALISFFIGIFGLVFTYTAPNKEFIQAEFNTLKAELIEKFESKPNTKVMGTTTN